jgi:sec-independent protein translocase protein TatB
MFDLSWSHILIVLIVALVVVGPKDLPKMMRMVGRWLGKARAMADQFRKSFDEMARQSELDELRSEIEALRTQRPLAGIEQSLNQSILPPDPPVVTPESSPVLMPGPAVEMADGAAPASGTPHP